MARTSKYDEITKSVSTKVPESRIPDFRKITSQWLKQFEIGFKPEFVTASDPAIEDGNVVVRKNPKQIRKVIISKKDDKLTFIESINAITVENCPECKITGYTNSGTPIVAKCPTHSAKRK